MPTCLQLRRRTSARRADGKSYRAAYRQLKPEHRERTFVILATRTGESPENSA